VGFSSLRLPPVPIEDRPVALPLGATLALRRHVTLDMLITGGTVIDGTGAPRRRADVSIRDERVVAVAESGTIDELAATMVDAAGVIVCPGVRRPPHEDDGQGGGDAVRGARGRVVLGLLLPRAGGNS
jgi:hypothetical protein